MGGEAAAINGANFGDKYLAPDGDASVLWNGSPLDPALITAWTNERIAFTTPKGTPRPLCSFASLHPLLSQSRFNVSSGSRHSKNSDSPDYPFFFGSY
jgi:hypothetical protein